MRRPAVALGLVPALALVVAPLIAGPARAKPGHEEEPTMVAIVAGPGLDEPIRLEGRDARRMLSLTTFRGAGLAEAVPPSPEALGPRYVATYLLEREGRPPVLLAVQDLHPYAPGRAWASTAPTGATLSVPSGGWHSVALPERLAAWGLPAAPPTGTSAAAPADPLATGRGSPTAGIWLGLATVLVLAAVGAAARRGSAAPTAATTAPTGPTTART